jgi:hypothetical protein
MPSEVPLTAALEALVACDRLTAQLPPLAAWLDHAASIARAEWTGPHRDAFDDRIVAIRGALLDATAALPALRTRVVPRR